MHAPEKKILASEGAAAAAAAASKTCFGSLRNWLTDFFSFFRSSILYIFWFVFRWGTSCRHRWCWHNIDGLAILYANTNTINIIGIAFAVATVAAPLFELCIRTYGRERRYFARKKFCRHGLTKMFVSFASLCQRMRQRFARTIDTLQIVFQQRSTYSQTQSVFRLGIGSSENALDKNKITKWWC